MKGWVKLLKKNPQQCSGASPEEAKRSVSGNLLSSWFGALGKPSHDLSPYLYDRCALASRIQVKVKCLRHCYEYERLRIEAEKGHIHRLLKRRSPKIQNFWMRRAKLESYLETGRQRSVRAKPDTRPQPKGTNRWLVGHRPQRTI